ncbi:MAG: TRAP transporter small permease subunit [Aminobacterium sp.]|jgi:TRAP-type C4-dicarboxylate transport system permease small subunit|uniref:TRAP transporter small permease n=1 Tax=unclassified Aminobacterium TaxID=2685012 RepID=UPI001BCBD840|nr:MULTISPECIES: TRAP transporter small permease subunit [unclassified Aminobacterium]MDD2207352.1 TRAP transporter small permease subunit [Aminobacterium sp.]MDD3708094.1 TRAP transporter small permease subunit [Aminobacterium sp.]MDD4229573.1 TRAP transporter small permease subunit [Aminobacterium sp.]MDD4552155.1 TRAP transporter small permease subunit [Aminobacterium sp.]MEA4877879.1 TRAP transporter small permease subunit [Aminobacterium sp.]
MRGVFYFIWFILGKIQRYIMVLTSLVLVGLVITQVLLRYIFKLPIMGIEELACLVGFWMYMTGAANGSRERSHIQADLLHVLIKNSRAFAWAKTFTSTLVTILAFIMTSWAWNYVSWSFKSWERSPALMIPMIFAQASLLISASLMSFYFLIITIDFARRALGKPPLCLPNENYDWQAFKKEIAMENNLDSNFCEKEETY